MASEKIGEVIAPSKMMISSTLVEQVGAHEHVHVWNRGGKAGVLIVSDGDGAAVAKALEVLQTTTFACVVCAHNLVERFGDECGHCGRSSC